MKNKITVIVPCYNVQDYAERCLRSIERQTYGIENLEVILVDDASTDATMSVLRKFEQKYPENVLLIECKENGKQGAARNIGLEYATGEYITFVDSDDVIDITMIQKMHDKIVEYDCDIVDCGYKSFHDESEIDLVENQNGMYVSIDSEEKRKQYIINLSKLAVWGRLYKRQFIEDNHLRFLEGIYYEDVHFTGLLKLLVQTYYIMEEQLYFYFQNDRGTISDSRNMADKIKQELIVMDELFVEWDTRGLLQNALEQYYEEIEFFRMVNSFASPILYLCHNVPENIEELILYFRRGLLECFPNACNNVYFKAAYPETWEILIDFLGNC